MIGLAIVRGDLIRKHSTQAAHLANAVEQAIRREMDDDTAVDAEAMADTAIECILDECEVWKR